MDRKLDGVFFRVKRNGKFEDVCFSDLTSEQMDEVLKRRRKEWLKDMCKFLGNRIHEIGDELDLTMEEES